MNIPSKRVITLTFFLIFGADFAAAQSSAGPLTGNEITSAQIAARLSSSTLARVVIHGERINTAYPRVVGDSLVADVNGKRWSAVLFDVDTIWVKTGTRARPFATIVGIPFGILGIFAGSALACGDNPAPCRGQNRGAILGAFIFTAIGAIPAAVVGSMLTRWDLIFLRSPSSR